MNHNIQSKLNSNQKVLRGTKKRDSLMGSNKNERLMGLSQNDRLMGRAGNDFLNGGRGKDQLTGGKGNDTYFVDHTGDQVKELANQGVDTVRASISYTLGDNLENLILTGGADLNATGNSLANVITGNNGKNIIDGRLGADTMIGGNGDDTYFVDDLRDVVTEQVNGGIDTVKTTIANYARPVNVEFLEYIGTANFTATAATPSGTNTTGTNDTGTTITSSSGNDTLGGGTSSDTLQSGAGNDVLNGGAGADTMAGGTGDDTYVVDTVLDTLQEGLNGGIDLVRSTVDYVLGGNLENLDLLGTALNGTGNDLANIITGTDGNNLLKGGLGDDKLLGGAGLDTLVGGLGLDTLTGGTGIDSFALTELGNDLITDFASAEDLIVLDKTVLGLPNAIGEKLTSSQFATVASDALATVGALPAKVIYSAETGKLFYDANGILPGLGDGGTLATLKDATGQVPILSSVNFVVDTIV